MDHQSTIAQWIQEKCSTPEFAQYFLIELQISPSRKVTAFMDGDQGIDLDACKAISRFLEHKLDETDIMGAFYSLEVSSPGATQPLVMPRQYPKHKGRKLVVTLEDQSKIEGTLSEVGDDTLTLTLPKTKTQKEAQTINIPFSGIVDARVVISFK